MSCYSTQIVDEIVDVVQSLYTFSGHIQSVFLDPFVFFNSIISCDNKSHCLIIEMWKVLSFTSYTCCLRISFSDSYSLCSDKQGKNFPVHVLCIVWNFTSIVYIIRDAFSKLKNSIPCLTVPLFPACALTWSGALICCDTQFSFGSAIKCIHPQVLLPTHILLCVWPSLRILACLFSCFQTLPCL